MPAEHIAAAVLLAALLVVGATLFHFEALDRLQRATQSQQRVRHAMVVRVLAVLILVHLSEILFYAVAYEFARQIGIGRLHAVGQPLDALSYFYYSAETYSTLGYGDIEPLGGVRLMASVEPLNGILLLAWSGAFLFSLVQRAARR